MTILLIYIPIDQGEKYYQDLINIIAYKLYRNSELLMYYGNVINFPTDQYCIV
jgi:hypothetical protein